MTESPHLITVFDTNAYVGLGHAALARMAAREAQTQVLALASVWPCLELLACCIGPDYRIARRAHVALNKLLVHAGYHDSDGHHLRLHEAGEFSLVRGLFGIDVRDPLLEIGFLGNLAVSVATASLEEGRELYSDDLRRASERVRLEEDRFADMAAAAVATYGTQGSRHGAVVPEDLTLIAAGLVRVLAEQHRVHLAAQDFAAATRAVVHHFSVALAFVRGIITDLPGAGTAPGGANSTWDLKMAFHAARGASVSGIPVLVVSDDRRLRRAAREADELLHVATMSEYQGLLEQPEGIANRSAAMQTEWSAC